MGTSLLNAVENEKTNRYYRNHRLAIYEAKLCKVQSELYEYLQELFCTDSFIRGVFSDMKMYGRSQFTTEELNIIDGHLENYRKVNEEMIAYEDKIRVKYGFHNLIYLGV